MPLARRVRALADSGFTMLELVVVMAIAGTLMAIGTFGFTNWQSTAQHQGTADELVSALRNSATRAVSEGRTYCVAFAADGKSYTHWRTACGAGGTQVDGVQTVQDTAVTLDATVPYPSTAAMPSPVPACPASHDCLYFYPRGTALPAAVTVTSAKRSKTYTVRVEGLTARVYQ